MVESFAAKSRLRLSQDERTPLNSRMRPVLLTQTQLSSVLCLRHCTSKHEPSSSSVPPCCAEILAAQFTRRKEVIDEKPLRKCGAMTCHPDRCAPVLNS